MKELKFKTNINCGNCLAKVSPFLNDKKEVSEWEVDLSHTDKVLTVKTESLTAAQVEATVLKSGFSAKSI